METNSLKTVERSLDVLECFISDTNELSFTEIKEATGYSKSVVFRLLQTLESRNFLHKDEVTGKYRLGNEILSLGFIAKKNSTIINRTERALIELHEKLDQNTNIYMLTKGMRMCINQRLCSIIQKTSIKVGGIYPLHLGAAGHAILAFMDNNSLLEVYESIEEISPGYVKRHNLNVKLDKVRSEKVAVQLGNDLDDIVCISAPFFGNDSKILGCISVSGVKYIFPEDIESVKILVKSYAEDVSAKYGNKSIKIFNE